MRKLIVITMVLFGFVATANGQIEEKMQKEGVVQGAIYKDGQEIEGYIKKKGTVSGVTNSNTYAAPWDFQSDIRFIPKDVFEETSKLQAKMYKKYGPKDIEGYRYEDMEFESVKYADMRAVGMNMIPKLMFLRRITNNKISIFYYYQSPGSVVAGGSMEQEYQNCAKELVVFRKGKEGKVKMVAEGLYAINIEKELGDCPYVKEKHERGEYKGRNLESRLEAIYDYNRHCN